jgi:hypothetical protein
VPSPQGVTKAPPAHKVLAAREKQSRWREANREKHRVRERERMREKRAALKTQKQNTPGA